MCLVTATFYVPTILNIFSGSKRVYGDVPIDLSQNQIRLFDLHPGDWDDRIRGTLRVVSLDSSPVYQALSYTWGPKKGSRSLCMKRKSHLPCRRNLYTALRSLRSETNSLTLWIDAICIDQNDRKERSHQVCWMDRIYTQAESVLVWLGEPSHEWERGGDCQTEGGYQKDISSLRPSSVDLLALESDIQNTRPRWMDRQWVIQGFVLARKVYACFGKTRVKMDIRTLNNTPEIELPQLRGLSSRMKTMAILGGQS
jgi:hypothetical protein